MKLAGPALVDRAAVDADRLGTGAALRAGEVVVRPTETFYALAADSRLAAALEDQD